VDPLNTNNIANPNRRDPSLIEDYDNLGIDPEGPNYVVTTVNSSSQLVQIPRPATATPPSRPQNADFTNTPLTGGGDGTAALGAPEYIGGDPPPAATSDRRGLAGLEVIDEISLLCVPDHVNDQAVAQPAERTQITNAVINQCERLKERFAILNIARGQGDVNNIPPRPDSSYGAVYYPWVRVFDPRTRDTLLVPPGGHVAGIIARTDIERGVHKAPANAVVQGIIDRDLNGQQKPLEYQITKGQHDILNPRGINVIRDFRADRRGIRLWGARTMSSDAEWKYVNVRRLFLFVEESIDEGTQWVVFEPNDEPTWAKVRRSITNFLISVWRSGALMGATQDEAFFVKCDRTTMTQDDIDNGRLICLIGIAPVKPAEFVIFRISQKTAFEVAV
jgi:phage tail sheath protein FI